MVEFFNYYKLAFKNYLNIKGRSRRKEYWYFVLGNLLISIFLSFIDFYLFKMNILHNLFFFITLIPTFTVSIRRLHDIEKSGKWIFLNFLPLFILILGLLISNFIPKDEVEFFLFIIIGLMIITSFFISVLFFIWFIKIGTFGSNKYGKDPLIENKDTTITTIIK